MFHCLELLRKIWNGLGSYIKLLEPINKKMMAICQFLYSFFKIDVDSLSELRSERFLFFISRKVVLNYSTNSLIIIPFATWKAMSVYEKKRPCFTEWCLFFHLVIPNTSQFPEFQVPTLIRRSSLQFFFGPVRSRFLFKLAS